jgi:hypothetical protein
VDDNWAVGVPYECDCSGTQHEGSQVATTARAHHDHGSRFGEFEEHLAGITKTDQLLHGGAEAKTLHVLPGTA